MSEKPWFKFYPGDWRADAALRMCSPTARCLWIEMICLMADADPVGHLLVKGRPVTERALASLSGLTLEEVTAGITELDTNEVFSRTAEGVIYSRKMVRAARKSGEQRGKVEKRWEAEKQRKLAAGNTDGDTTQHTDGDTKPHTETIPYSPKPEARGQSKSSVPDGTGAEPPLDLLEVDPLVTLRQLPIEKGAWRLAVKVLTERGRQTEQRARALIGKLVGAGLSVTDLWSISEDAWANGTLDPVPYLTAAAQRIAGERYSDEITAPSERQQLFWAQEFRDHPRQWKVYERGPPPGQPGCRIRPEILAEFGLMGAPA